MPEANAATLINSWGHWTAECPQCCKDHLRSGDYLQWLLAQRLLGLLSAPARAPQ